MVRAELVFNISEEIVSPSQTNLLLSISGSVDTDGLTFISANIGGSFINLNTPYIATQAGSSDAYILPDSLPSFGADIDLIPQSNTGAIILYDEFLEGGLIGVPRNYVSEAPLEATMTFHHLNFDSLSLIAGESYSTSWAVGTADEDSLTVNIVPESTNFTISPSIVNGQFVISYTSDSGFSYQLEQSGNLNSGSWTNHGSAVVGNDATNSFTINPADATLRYYRVQSHVQE
jgi:hypothetical protein